MEVSCTTCNRTFEVDERTTREVSAARCVCGARIGLGADSLDHHDGTLRLGKYVLLQRIAVGGMGEIYYGKIAGVEGFEREVAIKKMLPHLSEDRAFIDMMIKEAKLTVLLHHPNIVQVYDLAKEGREYYIAMEYVPGITVGHLLELSHRTGIHLPFEISVHVTMQVLRGLAYAHDLHGPSGKPMNILHRDITPQNILITRDAWVKITDFGIAKARNEISTTSPGMIKGKLGYIAPEQLSGQPPDQRVDIFCAGILMWESLATRRLFKGIDEIDTFRLISECKIPPLAGFRDDVPFQIEQALHGALTRSPEERYRTADDFYDALNHAIFPGTADELAAHAKRYFDAHPELFKGIAKHIGPDTEPNGITSQPPVEDLKEITGYIIQPRKGRTLKRPLVISTALVLLLLVLGFVFKDDIFTRRPSAPLSTPTAALNSPLPSTLEPLTADEVQLAVDGEEPGILACYKLGNKSFRRIARLTATLVIPSTGSIASVSLEPPDDQLGKPASCIETVLRGMKLRRHPAPSYEVTVSLPPPAKVKPPPVVSYKKLTGTEIQTMVQKKSVPIARCLNLLAGVPNPPTIVNATITISQAGRVTAVDLAPRLPKADAEQCLRRSLKALKFRRQPVKDFKATIPLKITQI